MVSCKPEDVSDIFSPNNKPYYEESDPYFDSWKRDFEKDYYLYTGKTIDLSKTLINITNNKYFRTNSYADGVCMTRHKEILIKKDAWNNMNNNERVVLFYHEIGHCVLDYDHIDYPGIMFPSWVAPSSIWGNGFESDLLEDFFNPTNETKNTIKNIQV